MQQSLGTRACSGAGFVLCMTLDEEFERVWAKYPRKVGKGAASKAWTRARSGTEFMQIAAPLIRKTFAECAGSLYRVCAA